MKRFCLWAALLLLPLAAKEFTVTLQPVPGEEQVFFLDLRNVKADSSTFRLTDDKGKALPFSFDMRIHRKKTPGKYYHSPDGFYSKECAPAAEERYLYPGWLSFRAVSGAKYYTFTFRDGAKRTESRPDPAVRAWWIEVMKDPEFRDISNLSFKERSLRQLSGGGVEVSKPFMILRKAANVDERSRGRRVLGLLRSEGGVAYFNYLQKNAIIQRVSALSCYIKNLPGEVTDWYAEGIIDYRPGELFSDRRFISVFHYIQKNAKIFRFSVQLPPSDLSAGVRIPSDLLNTGDTVNFSVYGLGFPNTIPFSSGGIGGLRAGIWNGVTEVFWSLFDMQGRKILSGRGMSMTLNHAGPGKYLLKTVLTVDGFEAARQEFPVTVQKGAF